MKIGLLGFGLVDWGGGRDMLRQFMAALQVVQASHRLEITVLLPDNTPPWPAELRATRLAAGMFMPGALQRIRQVRWALQERGHVSRNLMALVKDLGLADPGAIAYRACRGLQGASTASVALDLDVLMACTPPLGAGFPVPWCGYLPDVQHRRLPHMFSEGEIHKRDVHFTNTLAHADAMLATSQAVANDLTEFYGGHRHCEVLPMAWLPIERPDAGAIRLVAARYGVQRPYFIICNQFWRHKDHETAFRAFAAVRRASAGVGVQLVCTGDTADYRHADHFGRMTALIEELGITPHVHILGRIEKQDQLALLAGAVALVQPSLFEGTRGGLAVADALALGQRCIVSDIAVNRELDEAGVRFFAVGDPCDLAQQMLAVLAIEPKAYDAAAQQQLCKERLHAMGDALVAAARSAMNSRRQVASPDAPSPLPPAEQTT